MDLIRRFIRKYVNAGDFTEKSIESLLLTLGRVPSATDAASNETKLYNALIGICLDEMGRSHLDVKNDTIRAILENPNVHTEVKYAVVKLICDREEPIPSNLFDAILEADWSHISDYMGWEDGVHVSSNLTYILRLLIDKNKMDWDAITNWYGKRDRVLLSEEWSGIYLLIAKAPDLGRVDSLFTALFDRVSPDVQLGMLTFYTKRASVERCRFLIEGFLSSGRIVLAQLNYSVKMAVSEILFCNGPLKKIAHPSCGHPHSTEVDWQDIYAFLWTGKDVKAAEVAINRQARRIARGEVRDHHELSFFVKVLSPYVGVLSLEEAFRWIVSHPQEAGDSNILATTLDGLIKAFNQRDSFQIRIPFDFVPAFVTIWGLLAIVRVEINSKRLFPGIWWLTFDTTGMCHYLHN